jgi:NitT/TauT family transport system permease protein
MNLSVDKFCAVGFCAAAVAVLVDATSGTGSALVTSSSVYLVLVLAVSIWFARKGAETPLHGVCLLVLVGAGTYVTLDLLYAKGLAGNAPTSFWLLIIALWALVWRGIDCIATFKSLVTSRQRTVDIFIPILFGAWLIFLWEVIVVGFDVPHVLLPPPSAIAVRFASSLDILQADFHQTFMKAVLAGYIMGCGAGFIVAIMVDRVPFLQRGLLPLGNLVSALPIVGVAPIMVMWFGFDWQSKAAVVVIMTFFPMLVNTVAGLAEAGALEKDLMRSYGAGYWQNLFKLRLPAALPFVFNALKINSTLAMIGAIVAEFFGTPIVGMGFRISTEVGRMNVDMVWAEIVVAAIAGSAFYGVMALLERKFTFWHASYRQTR